MANEVRPGQPQGPASLLPCRRNTQTRRTSGPWAAFYTTCACCAVHLRAATRSRQAAVPAIMLPLAGCTGPASHPPDPKHQVASKIVEGSYPPITGPDALTPYSDELKRMVATLLTTNPDKRPSIREVRRSLRPGSIARSSSQDSDEPESRPRGCRDCDRRQP